MMIYQTLNGISTKMIYETFIEAFSDYQVAMHLSYEEFLQILVRKGYNEHLSMGAFKQRKLVGFVLNASRMWNGKVTIYDLGTGVIPCMRKQGITSQMLKEVKKLMKDYNIEQYLLEVLQTNENALQLYLKQGFEIQRELKCYRIQKENYQIKKKHKVCHVNYLELDRLKEFWNCQPSWQNSNDSILVDKEQYYFSVVYDENHIIGYGVIHKKSGDVGQLAVSPSYRNQGIGQSLLSDLIQRTMSPMIQVLNVEDEKTQQFLKHVGFKNYVDQYEMILNIKNC